MKKIVLTVFLILASSPVWATTYYIRTDGGTATQCLGTTDAAYDGSGSGEACALNHLNWVFPGGSSDAVARKAVAGDTVVVDGSDQGGTGSYRIGCQNDVNCRESTFNMVTSGTCFKTGAYGCILGTIPNSVTVVGCTTSGCGCTQAWVSGKLTTTCTHPRPELWGAGRIYQVLDIQGSSNVVLKDLEVTDHEACGEGHPTMGSCNSYAYLSARDGIAQTSSSGAQILGMWVHGLYRKGIYGGSVGDNIYNGTTIDFNASAGIDLDSCSNNGTCGVQSGHTMTFTKTSISNNGCIESVASKGTAVTGGCYEQNSGGYGDGISSSGTAGDWTVTDSDISHNTSDGWDLLYHTSIGSITMKRTRAEGNNGNQVKLPNNSYLEDNYIIGNCSYFYNQSFTYGTNNYSSFNFCRAFGNPILFNFASGGAAVDPKLYNNTITSNGDVMIQTSGTCSGRSVLVKNNLLLGGRQAQDDHTMFNGAGGDDKTSIFYNADGTCAATFTEDYNTCSNTFKEASPCPASHSKNNIAPSSTYSGTITEGPTTYYNGSSYLGQLTLKATSTAIDTALSSLSGADSYGFGIAPQERGGTWDMGALDYAAGAAVCGNSIIETGETCDDSNASSTDGCSSSCLIETGYSCTGTPSTCTAICGDGLVKAAEGCDDANVISADGCSSTCTVESGYGCVGTAPSVCTPTGGGGGGVTGPSGKFTASGRFSY